MVVDDLDVPGFAIAPHETDPPLVVDANAVLSLSISAQCLQTIAGRHAQIRELLRGVEHKKLFPRTPLNLGRQTANGKTRENRGRALVAKAPDHDEA